MDRCNLYQSIVLFGLLFCSPPLFADDPAKTPTADAAALESPPAGRKTESAETGDKTKKSSLTKNEIAVWSLFSVTGAAVITGGVFGLTALDEQNRYDDNPESVYRHRRDERMIASAVFFGAAGAAAIATLVLWATDKKHRREKPSGNRAPAASVSFDPGGAVLVTF